MVALPLIAPHPLCRQTVSEPFSLPERGSKDVHYSIIPPSFDKIQYGLDNHTQRMLISIPSSTWRTIYSGTTHLGSSLLSITWMKESISNLQRTLYWEDYLTVHSDRIPKLFNSLVFLDAAHWGSLLFLLFWGQ